MSVIYINENGNVRVMTQEEVDEYNKLNEIPHTLDRIEIMQTQIDDLNLATADIYGVIL